MGADRGHGEGCLGERRRPGNRTGSAIVEVIMKPSLIALAALAVFAAAACGSADDAAPLDATEPDTSEPDTSEPDLFGDTVWQLTAAEVDGAALSLLDTHPVTLTSSAGNPAGNPAGDPDTIGGTAACNNYGGQFTATADVDGTVSLTFGDLFSTEMACVPDEANQLESAYLAALPRVTTAERTGDTLVLSGEGVRLDFTARLTEPTAALTGTTWVLDSVISGDAVSSSVSSSVSSAEATLTIADDGTVSGSTGCNRLNGSLTVAADRFEPTALATTRMACEPALMEQEQAVVAVLGGGPIWSIDGQTLTLQLDDGRGLAYRAAV